MTNETMNAEERRLIILRGIGQDHTTIEIAAEMGVRKWMVLNDLRAMNYNRDPELKQAYLDKEIRAHAGKQSRIHLRDERFRHMTGMTFQEKNFENMINYYKAELETIYKSRDECTAITGLSNDIRKTLKRNDILTGHRNKIQLTAKARDYLLLRN
jgi:type IV secretory pathway TrbD component